MGEFYDTSVIDSAQDCTVPQSNTKSLTLTLTQHILVFDKRCEISICKYLFTQEVKLGKISSFLTFLSLRMDVGPMRAVIVINDQL